MWSPPVVDAVLGGRSVLCVNFTDGTLLFLEVTINY